MAQARVHASALKTALKGSLRAHEDLIHAALQLLALRGIPAVPIHTGPRVAPREGGGFDLLSNPLQRGFGDIAGCLPPWGRLLMLEGKSGNARRSPGQVRTHERFERAGAICLTFHNIPELARAIDLEERRIPINSGHGRSGDAKR